MRKRILFSIGAAFATTVIIGGIGSADATNYTWDPSVTAEVDGEDVYLWGTPSNWEPRGAPDDAADEIHINHSGVQRAVLNYNAREDDGHGTFSTYIGVDGDGTLDILDLNDGTLLLAGRRDELVLGRGGGNTGTINQYGGLVTSYPQAHGNPVLGEDGGSGIYNLMGGKLELLRSRIHVGYSGGGSSEFNITGGALDATDDRQGREGLLLGVNDAKGTFNVAGSGAESIKLVAVEQGANGTLKFGIDADGTTPIEVPGGSQEDTPGNVIFHSGAILDVEWLNPDNPVTGAWTVMEWTGDLLDGDGNKLFGTGCHLTMKDFPLAFAPEVDADTWSLEFLDTAGDDAPDTLRLTAVPRRAAKIEELNELSETEPEEIVERLAEILKARTLKERLKAVRALEEFGETAAAALSSLEAAPVIEIMLSDLQLHEKSVQTLLAAGLPEKTVSGLSEALRTSGRDVRMAAMESLDSIAPGLAEKAIPALLEILSHRNVRVKATETLTALGAEEKAAESLLEMVRRGQDEGAVVVELETLKAIKTGSPGLHGRLAEDPAAIEVLLELTRSHPTDSPYVETGIEVLRLFDEDPPDDLFDWPMWRYDAARSAQTPLQLSDELHLQWRRELPEPKRAWRHQWDDRGKLDFDVSYAPVVMGDRIFVPSNVTDSVTSYSIEDGEELWRFYTDGPVRLAPAAWNNRVYFISDDGHLYCVNAETGELDWKFRGGPSDHRLLGNERIINFWAARGGPLVKEGKVYFTAGLWPLHGVFIYALDAVTGEVEWVNDNTSSAYVDQPHRGWGYGGLAPQGYIAGSEGRLVVSGGRGPAGHFDRYTGESVQLDPGSSRRGGGYGVHIDGMGVKRNKMLQNRVDSVSEHIEGDVFYKLAARDRLFVTTENGTLYCFGPEETDPREHIFTPASLEPETTDWTETADEIMELLEDDRGYALMLGAGSGDLLRELLNRGELHIAVVEPDADRARALRDELSAAGKYGRRAAVIKAEPATFSVQPYLFSLVVSEDAAAAGIGADETVFSHLLDLLRPYSGVAWFGLPEGSAADLSEAAKAADVDQISIEERRNHLLFRRGGPLTGAGRWTHQYHDAANTLMSRDERVRLPLGVLWFGGPTHDNILPRHGGGPRPQVVGGRQIFLGVETIAARCVYTGRELWEREFPGIGHPFTNIKLEKRWAQGNGVYMPNLPGATYIGSPFVSKPDAVYLRHEGRIHCLDPATGATMDTFEVPGRSPVELYDDDNAPDWGTVLAAGDYLITTSEPHILQDKEEVPDGSRGMRPDSILGWFGSYSGTSSRRIAVLDRFSGELQGTLTADIGFRHNAIAAAEDILFVIDGLSKKGIEHLARRGRKPEDASKISAFDLETGETIWQSDSDVFGTYLAYSKEHDILIEGGSRDMRVPFNDEPIGQVTARRGRSGEVLWKEDRGEDVTLPGVLRDDMLIPGRPGRALSLLTGETWMREQPHTGRKSEWNYNRTGGCNLLNASKNMLLFRTGFAGYTDLEYDAGTGTFSGFRAGCTANLIAADGVLNALDYTRTCTCGYQHQTSLALIHMPGDSNIEFWTRYEGAYPDPEGHGLNFGAPGRRVDVAGSGRTWHDRPGTRRRHPSAIQDSGNSLSWVLASTKEINPDEDNNRIRVDDLLEGEYAVRLHFAELDPEVKPGDRVFDVLVNGEKVLSNFDIVAIADGPFRGVVRGGPLKVDHYVEIEFRSAGDSELAPIINGMELINAELNIR